MEFSLYSEMTVKQALKAVDERIAQKGTKTRPDFDGWTNPDGRFMLQVDRKVWRWFHRTTRLHATISRESGITVIAGRVPDGIGRDGMTLIMGGVGLLAVVLFAQGDLIFALMSLGIGVVVGSQIWGDHLNHDVLLYDLERTLSAKPKPPAVKVNIPNRR